MTHSKIDPNAAYFTSRLMQTTEGHNFIVACKALNTLKTRLTTKSPFTVAGLAKMRRQYIETSNACAELQATLEKRYGWPAP